MTTCTVENRCVEPTMNSPESMCPDCEQRDAEARAKRNEDLRGALREFADQMPGQMWDYAVTATISALVRSLSLDGRCKLCGCYNGHATKCAVEGLREVME